MGAKVKASDALEYHSQSPAGKLEVIPTKILSSQRDLALAYSPGVAEPCLAIQEDESNAYRYTSKGNLVAVISNGTAVLGLGNIGALASKPVMEGKAVLFKKFAGIDVFDIEVNETDPKKFVEIVKALEPTFGGVNLEDIKAPESFYVEDELRKQLRIPVMHDDQHGTAIISSAALLNALEIVRKDIKDIQVVVNGAGAAAISCAKLYLSIGVQKKNLVMLDSKGVIRTDRKDIDSNKRQFATDRDIKTLADAMSGADVFLGLSVADSLSPDHLEFMSKDPIVFALANPKPEIDYDLAMKTRKDIIMATGRSDHPNQVNNVLGFPYIFRGALDVRASEINEEMKLAAVYALAELAKEPVPEIVSKAYGKESLSFGKKYLIPKPFDPRLITCISPAVAKAAISSGTANDSIEDWPGYAVELQKRIGIDQKFISVVINRAKRDPKRIIFAEANDPRVLMAAEIVKTENIGQPILLGNKSKILPLIDELNLDLHDCPFIDVYERDKQREQYGQLLWEKRQRKGISLYEATKKMQDRNYFGAMMLEMGEADALISGLTKSYPQTIRPSLQIIGVEEGYSRVAGMYIIHSKRGTFFFSDTTVSVDPSPEELVDIIALTARAVRLFNIEPRVAALSYSNFGSSKGKVPDKMRRAVELTHEKHPDLIIDGDIQANVALSSEIMEEMYPFSKLVDSEANTFIFPDLASGNIAYKLMIEIGGFEAIGPILLGTRKPVHILQPGSTIRDIVNMSAIAVVDAQLKADQNHNQ